MHKDEQGSLILTVEYDYKVNQSMRNMYDPDLLAIGLVDADLACGQKDVPGIVVDDAISSLLNE